MSIPGIGHKAVRYKKTTDRAHKKDLIIKFDNKPLKNNATSCTGMYFL
jgi:hypothetical protein